MARWVRWPDSFGNRRATAKQGANKRDAESLGTPVYDKRSTRQKRDWRALQRPPVFSRFDTKPRFCLVDKRAIRNQNKSWLPIAEGRLLR